MKRISRAAKDAERSWEKIRSGAKHDLWECGQTRVPIPRHNEINEYTAEGIMKDLDGELGKDWWR
jgi:hypothetical protein